MINIYINKCWSSKLIENYLYITFNKRVVEIYILGWCIAICYMHSEHRKRIKKWENKIKKLKKEV